MAMRSHGVEDGECSGEKADVDVIILSSNFYQQNTSTRSFKPDIYFSSRSHTAV